MNTAIAEAPLRHEQDLGPLAWVIEELRRTMDAAAKSLRCYLREADATAAGASALTTPDIGHLDQALHLLHQCSGALEMIDQRVPAKLLRAMEAAVRRFAGQPSHCTDDAVAHIERAGFAVADYLDAVLAGKPAPAVGLFPQYRDVQAVAGSDRIHPADLWSVAWAWLAPPPPENGLQLPYAPPVRSRLDQAVLKSVKAGDPQAARELQQLSLALAAGTDDTPQRSFWSIASAYFQALSLGLVPADLYAKRIASRVLTQYAALAKGGTLPSERLAQDMLFYCAGAVPPDGIAAATLQAVRGIYGLQQARAVDYEERRFGRFDPAQLAQARKRIAAAAEIWSALTGGDTQKFKPALDQFAMVGESLTRLHSDSAPLAQALLRAVDGTARAGQVPRAPLAMEIATAVLYLEAAYADLDQSGTEMQLRAELLAGRLERVLQGGEPEPLAPWMEDLYRRVIDRQTMGSVVAELGKTLNEVEQALDQYFRAPRETDMLGKVTSQLSQMGGVLSVLGLDQASHAVMRIHETVDGYMAPDTLDEAARNASFERLGSSLGALGFLIDMLSYQPALAKKLFAYDEEQRVFRLVTGRQGDAAQATARAPLAPVAPPMAGPVSTVRVTHTPTAKITVRRMVMSSPPATGIAATDGAGSAATQGDDELRGIFLIEARQVAGSGLAAVQALRSAPHDLAQQTTLRRAFHTLKGSARMVGLDRFGEAGWAMELLLNAWLAEQQPASAALLDLSDDALQAFSRWTEDIAARRDGTWRAEPFRASADAMRLQRQSLALAVPGARPADEPRPPATAIAAAAPAEPVQPVAADLLPPDDQEHVKVVGPLQIGLPLYNVYLNEADAWSRQLQAELGKWALEPDRPVPDAAAALAHSLGGSSATVGFDELSQLARTLEHALGHVAMLGPLAPPRVQALIDAAEEIGRLLHQFAAGFLKSPHAAVEQALSEILAIEPPPCAAELEAEFSDDVDAVDTIDPDLFPVFEEEAAELLPRLAGALRQWHAQPDDAPARSEALRALHTLKGSARLAGALRLGELAHRLETMIERLGSEAVPAPLIEPLLHRCDALLADLDLLRRTHRQGEAAPTAADAAATASAPVAGRQPAPIGAAPLQQTLGVKPQAGQTLRVRSQLLDQLVNQAGEVMITRARLEARIGQLRGALGELGGNLQRLRSQLRDLELQAESQMQSRLAQAKESAQGFDPLEFDRFTRVQELTRMMAESVNDVAAVQRTLQRTIEGTEDDLVAQARQAREMQHDLLRTRMVEFESISERLYGVVRQAAKDSGRQVRLDISGGSIELDRGVLERMAPAFEHLLRNAVAHGIETPEERQAAGKSATGAISIALGHEANDIAVSFGDDGRGLDLAGIQAKAVSLGRLSSGQALSAAEAADLIFLPGFSTASQVTELAGRGIGLDVVRAEVQALGGRIETHSKAGQGTRFAIVLPLTTAVTQVVMLRAGELVIGVPTNLVEAVRRVPADELARLYGEEGLAVGGETLPLFWMGALLQSSAGSVEAPRRFGTVAVLRSAAQRLALHVDEVLGNREVVVKNLGPQLSRLPGLAGMSVLPSGAAVLIYNPVALATVYGAQARQTQQDRALRGGDPASVLPDTGTVPLVLVVDDSITVRRVTQRLLQREGYRVALAADGLQALERLQEDLPALVLSDIEMPRMDGFDLARNIRGDARWKDLPIVMITSRMAEKHREHARAIGVNHYLGKPYSEEELLSLVRRYTAVPSKD